MKTVVVFQGGGALGAFGAGAWQVLAERLGSQHGQLIAVAGASIGALNAATVAHHHADADGGAQTIGELWTAQIATPSWPFMGHPCMPVADTHANAERWNGFITGVLLGNRALFRASWPAWQPVSGLARLQQPLHDRSPMWQLLEQRFPSYRSRPGEAPMLAVAAVDVKSGELRLFDSDSAPLGARELAASSAMPLLFDAVEIDRRLYWDGEVTRESMLPPLLSRLIESGRLKHREALQLVTIDQFPRELAALPQSGAEIVYRVLNLMQLGKLEPPPFEGLRHGRLIGVARRALPEDGVSGQFDYSPLRIERLMQQGRDIALQATGWRRPNDLSVRTRGPAPAQQVRRTIGKDC